MTRSLMAPGHRVLPFACLCGLAFAATFLQTAGTNWALVGVAAGSAALLTVAASAPSRLAAKLLLPALPFAVDAVLAILRQAQGGSTSGYGPLAILPVVWIGLTAGRRSVAAITLWTAMLFAAPLVLIGAPMYPSTGWRATALWSVVAMVVGTVVRGVVSTQRRSAALEAARARNLDQLIETQTAISTSDLDIIGVMTLVASQALAVVGGDGACVEILDGDHVVNAAAAGTAVPHLGLRVRASETLTGECFRTGQLLVCTDSEQDSRVGRDACRLVGARSMVLIPLAHAGTVKGVLIVWSETAHEFTDHESQMLALLANTSGSALARAELLSQLSAQAATDELTGLANRREWHDRLDQAMARSARNHHSLSVLLLDLDGLKQVNDVEGHAAGDQLIKQITADWLTALRATDLLGRLGGDEFGVILEDTDKISAVAVTARLAQALRGPHTASAGLAVWNGHEDGSSLLARADTEMYRHKRTHAITGHRTRV